MKTFFQHTLLEACDFKMERNISSSCPLFFTGKETGLFRMYKQQSPTVYGTGISIQSTGINHIRNKCKKEYIFMCVTEPLCYTAKFSTL